MSSKAHLYQRGGLCEVFRTFDWSEMMVDLGKLKEESNILSLVK